MRVVGEDKIGEDPMSARMPLAQTLLTVGQVIADDTHADTSVVFS